MDRNQRLFTAGLVAGTGLGALAVSSVAAALHNRVRTNLPTGSEGIVLREKDSIINSWLNDIADNPALQLINEAIKDGRLRISIDQLAAPTAITLNPEDYNERILTVDSKFLGDDLDNLRAFNKSGDSLKLLSLRSFPFVVREALRAIDMPDIEAETLQRSLMRDISPLLPRIARPD